MLTRTGFFSLPSGWTAAAAIVRSISPGSIAGPKIPPRKGALSVVVVAQADRDSVAAAAAAMRVRRIMKGLSNADTGR